jgi:hypothetical protein
MNDKAQNQPDFQNPDQRVGGHKMGIKVESSAFISLEKKEVS